MIAARNRVYLVLDPEEATELQLILLRSSTTEVVHAVDSLRSIENRKTHAILRRLDAAIGRAKNKGAKFTK